MCVEVVVALVGVMLFLYLLAQSPGGRQGGVGVRNTGVKGRRRRRRRRRTVHDRNE